MEGDSAGCTSTRPVTMARRKRPRRVAIHSVGASRRVSWYDGASPETILRCIRAAFSVPTDASVELRTAEGQVVTDFGGCADGEREEDDDDRGGDGVGGGGAASGGVDGRQWPRLHLWVVYPMDDLANQAESRVQSFLYDGDGGHSGGDGGGGGGGSSGRGGEAEGREHIIGDDSPSDSCIGAGSSWSIRSRTRGGCGGAGRGDSLQGEVTAAGVEVDDMSGDRGSKPVGERTPLLGASTDAGRRVSCPPTKLPLASPASAGPFQQIVSRAVAVAIHPPPPDSTALTWLRLKRILAHLANERTYLAWVRTSSKTFTVALLCLALASESEDYASSAGSSSSVYARQYAAVGFLSMLMTPVTVWVALERYHSVDVAMRGGVYDVFHSFRHGEVQKVALTLALLVGLALFLITVDIVETIRQSS